MKYKKFVIIILLLISAAIAVFLAYSINKKKQNTNSNSSYVASIGAPTPEGTLSHVAEAIKADNTADALTMFDKGAHDKIKESLNQLDSVGKKELAHSIETAILDESAEAPNTDIFKTYATQIQVEGRGLITVHFYMIKLSNGNWVILDL